MFLYYIRVIYAAILISNFQQNYAIISVMKILINLLMLSFLFSSCQKAPTHEEASLWKPYSKEAVEQSIAAHKPIVIDFFAEWCPSCHELEQTVFSQPEIQAQLAHATTLRMDASDQDKSEVQAILQEYELYGLPTVIFLDKSGVEITNSRIEGLVSARKFSEKLSLLNE